MTLPTEILDSVTKRREFSRRDFLTTAAGVASASLAGVALAGADTEAHGEHGEHGEQRKYYESARLKKYPALVAAANECSAKGEACLSHCMETFLLGDTTMAECANAVQEMLPVCGTMSQLAAYDSKHLELAANLCIAVCEDCEKVCREHEEHQPECRECADACAALIKECRQVVT